MFPWIGFLIREMNYGGIDCNGIVLSFSRLGKQGKLGIDFNLSCDSIQALKAHILFQGGPEDQYDKQTGTLSKAVHERGNDVLWSYLVLL